MLSFAFGTKVTSVPSYLWKVQRVMKMKKKRKRLQ
jgi:hypothetical protein